MKVGDILTDKAFRKLMKKCSNTAFDGTYYSLGKLSDLVFKSIADNKWELESTFESRLADDGTSPNIHRPERKKYKGYYENQA